MQTKETNYHFETQHDQYKDRKGQSCKIVEVINKPDNNHDAEVLPMYLIEFNDGVRIEAWPDEVV